MDRITIDPRVRWGTPCVRDTGITVAHVVALDRAGFSARPHPRACPELTTADVDEALDVVHALRRRRARTAAARARARTSARRASTPTSRAATRSSPGRGSRSTPSSACGRTAVRIEEILDESPSSRRRTSRTRSPTTSTPAGDEPPPARQQPVARPGRGAALAGSRRRPRAATSGCGHAAIRSSSHRARRVGAGGRHPRRRLPAPVARPAPARRR